MVRPPLACLWLVCVLAACGGDPDAAGAGEEASLEAPAETMAPADPSTGCMTEVEVTEVGTGATTTLTEAGAVALGGGAAYTLYAADFPLDLGTASIATDPDVPAGGHLATIAATVFQPPAAPEPITAGTIVPAGTQTGELVFVATYQTDAERYVNNSGLTGSLTMREVGSTVCVDVDYTDDEKTIQGTIGTAAQEVP